MAIRLHPPLANRDSILCGARSSKGLFAALVGKSCYPSTRGTAGDGRVCVGGYTSRSVE